MRRTCAGPTTGRVSVEQISSPELNAKGGQTSVFVWSFCFSTISKFSRFFFVFLWLFLCYVSGFFEVACDAMECQPDSQIAWWVGDRPTGLSGIPEISVPHPPQPCREGSSPSPSIRCPDPVLHIGLATLLTPLAGAVKQELLRELCALFHVPGQPTGDRAPGSGPSLPPPPAPRRGRLC